MAKYCLNSNAQSDSGDYEVHQTSPSPCSYLPVITNRIDLGEHSTCQSAVLDAKKRYPGYAKKIDGCYYCSNACHNH